MVDAILKNNTCCLCAEKHREIGCEHREFNVNLNVATLMYKPIFFIFAFIAIKLEYEIFSCKVTFVSVKLTFDVLCFKESNLTQ